MEPLSSLMRYPLCAVLHRLLQPNPHERLGSKPGDLALLKTHQWFAGFDWGGLSRGEYLNQELRQVQMLPQNIRYSEHRANRSCITFVWNTKQERW